MAETIYPYSIADDFPGGKVVIGKLSMEIESSSIAKTLVRIGTNGDVIDLVFDDALSAAEKTTLDGDTVGPAGGLIAAHDNTAFPRYTERFYPADHDSSIGDFSTDEVLQNADTRLTFRVPYNFKSLVSLDLIGIVSIGAAKTLRDIDLSSDYGKEDEAYNNHSESNSAIQFNLSGQGNKVTAIDVSSVFTVLDAGDYCGLYVDHNAIGGKINYLGIRLRFKRG